MTQVLGGICSLLANPHCGQVMTASKSITAYFPFHFDNDAFKTDGGT